MSRSKKKLMLSLSLLGYLFDEKLSYKNVDLVWRLIISIYESWHYWFRVERWEAIDRQ